VVAKNKDDEKIKSPAELEAEGTARKERDLFEQQHTFNILQRFYKE